MGLARRDDRRDRRPKRCSQDAERLPGVNVVDCPVMAQIMRRAAAGRHADTADDAARRVNGV